MPCQSGLSEHHLPMFVCLQDTSCQPGLGQSKLPSPKRAQQDAAPPIPQIPNRWHRPTQDWWQQAMYSKTTHCVKDIWPNGVNLQDQLYGDRADMPRAAEYIQRGQQNTSNERDWLSRKKTMQRRLSVIYLGLWSPGWIACHGWWAPSAQIRGCEQPPFGKKRRCFVP
jgi:hypothetical protein